MAFTVILRRKAQADLAKALVWWSRHGRAAADRWRIRMLEAIVTDLEIDPLRYPLADEADDLGINLRERLYGRRRQVYRILFTIDGTTVNVHRVRHAAQDRLVPGDL